MNIFLRPLLVIWIVGLCLIACSGETASDRDRSDEVRDSPARSESSASAPAAENASEAVTVLVLGNSLAAGYGLDPSLSFPALLQARVDSLGWPVNVVNAGVSGETTAGGLSRIDWLLRNPVDVLILELGGNDGLRGTPLTATRANLQAIIDRTRAFYPGVHIVLAGMQIPPNLGPEYTAEFQTIYPELAEANDATLIPFLLEGVGGVPRLNQPDGIHPTAAGHRIVAENVWDILEPILIEQMEEKGCYQPVDTPPEEVGCEPADDLFQQAPVR